MLMDQRRRARLVEADRKVTGQKPRITTVVCRRASLNISLIIPNKDLTQFILTSLGLHVLCLTKKKVTRGLIKQSEYIGKNVDRTHNAYTKIRLRLGSDKCS